MKQNSEQKVENMNVSPTCGKPLVMGSTATIREIEEINRVHHLNFLNNTLPDKCANLIIADPPYFEVKGDFDFIWKDFKAYLEDVYKWAVECKRLLADNGTLFWYGHAKNIAYAQVILDEYFDLENHIKWRKTDCQTRKGYENYRIFPPVTEHILMYANGGRLDEIMNDQTLFKPIRDYFEAERKKTTLSYKEINEKCFGTASNGGGMASNILTSYKDGWTFPTKKKYEALQKIGICQRDYTDLRIEYDFLCAEYESKRRTFDNFMRMDDVWDFAQDVHITGEYDHPTKKTEKLATLMIKSTTKENDLVVIPFAGSGTECAMSAKDNRNFVAYDTELKYVEMSNKRVLEILRKPELFQ